MEENYRKTLIKILTFLGGIYFFVEFILPKAVLEKIGVAEHHSFISYGFIVVGSMAVGLGIINLFMVHGSRIIFRRKDWFSSVVLLVGLLVMMFATVSDWRSGLRITSETRKWTLLGEFTEVIEKDFNEKKEGVPSLDVRVNALLESIDQNAQQTSKLLKSKQGASRIPKQEPKFVLAQSYAKQIANMQQAVLSDSKELEASFDTETPDFAPFAPLRQSLDQLGVTVGKFLQLHYEYSGVRQTYNFLFHGLFVSLGSAMFSLLGVYIAAAAFRAFRVKTLESSLMMIAAVIVMLGQIPFYVYIYDGLPLWRQWLLEVPNSAAFRAIKIGASVAGLVMAFRMWFSIESESFADDTPGESA